MIDFIAHLLAIKIKVNFLLYRVINEYSENKGDYR
jgi:hypothetical protein